MRYLLMLVLAIVTILGVWSEGTKETSAVEKPMTLKVTVSGQPGAPEGYTYGIQMVAEALLQRRYPGTKVEYTIADTSTGADKTVAAQNAAGTPPDVYIDSWVRASAYLRADWALDLRGYMTDLDDYLPGALDGTTRNGAILGIPQPGGAQAMAVNLEICREVGFEPADWQTWTIDEFLQLGELVKQKYGGKKWVTGLFATTQSGDYLIRNWAAAFGANFYEGGDYTKTTINTPQGRQLLEFFAMLTQRGYVRSDWISRTDSDYVMEWAGGELATAPFFFGWIEQYFQTVEQAGGKRFDYQFVPLPRAPGVERVPCFYTGAGIVVHKSSDEERNRRAAAFAQAWNSSEAQTLIFITGKVQTNRKSVAKALSVDPQFAQVAAVVAANGTYDLGGTSQLYAASRLLFPNTLQRLMQPPKNVTTSDWVAKVLADYETEMNNLLSGK